MEGNNSNDSVHVAVNLAEPETSLTANRELLELAAKAAGITLSHWDHEHKTFSPVIGVAGTWWNPLTDDGDALRLAVKLRFDVNTGTECSSVSWGRYPVAGHAFEKHKGDACAATRRAIVRAAAEIAKAGISLNSPQAT